MNYYQQNNTSVRFTSIQVVNIVFRQITIDSNINNLLSKLKLSLSEFQQLVKLKMPSVDVKRKAIELSSTFEALMNATGEVDSSYRDDFSIKIIESCVYVITKYEEAESDEEFGFELKKELESACIEFFNREFGSQLNHIFWSNLNYYEWLEKEGFISNIFYTHHQRSERYFSDEQLEKFFKDNRSEIIRKMLNEQKDYNGNIDVRSPLFDNRKNIIFQTYKLLPKAIG